MLDCVTRYTNTRESERFVCFVYYYYFLSTHILVLSIYLEAYIFSFYRAENSLRGYKKIIKKLPHQYQVGERWIEGGCTRE